MVTSGSTETLANNQQHQHNMYHTFHYKQLQKTKRLQMRGETLCQKTPWLTEAHCQETCCLKSTEWLYMSVVLNVLLIMTCKWETTAGLSPMHTKNMVQRERE